MPYSKTLTRAKPLSTRHLKKCVSTSAHKHWLRSGTSPRRVRVHPAERGGLITASVCRRPRTSTNKLLEIERPASRRLSPAAIGDKRGKDSHYQRKQRRRHAAGGQRRDRRADHDEHEPGGRERGQTWPNAREPGEDHPQRAEHLAYADEVQKPARHRQLLRHVLDGHNELHATGE